MYNWMEMAAVVGKKFVENGQERILKRIHEGVTSNFFLDTSDFKESNEHLLLHLVWRKFPRNRCPTKGPRSSSHATQTDEKSRKEESPKTGLGLPILQ